MDEQKKKAQERFTKYFGDRIQAIRKDKNISQENLAELADINRSYMGRIERGESNPPVYTAYKIIKALQISAAELF